MKMFKPNTDAERVNVLIAYKHYSLKVELKTNENFERYCGT